MPKLAVIDMGSNSFRLVVFGYEDGGPWSLVDEIREPVRVSAGMGDEQVLRPERIELAVDTAEVFAAFCEASGVDDVTAIGTSAIRDAQNRDELVGEIRERTGLEVRVISGEEEAGYDYLAIANSTSIDDGFGLDIGGGSVQLVELRDRSLGSAASLPLGAVRVSERFLPDEEVSKKQLKAARRHVAEALGELDWLPGDRAGGRIAGIGGGIRNLAAAAQKRGGYPEGGVQGFLLVREELGEITQELASLPVTKRGRMPGIKPDRGDVILASALVLEAVLNQGEFDAIEVTESGLREGVFFERFLAPQDPPLLDDVRRDSVSNLAKRFRFDPRHADQVAKLSLEIYDGLADAGLREPAGEERELLWAACVLHDIGVAIDYDDHHKHSRYLILNSGLPGYSTRETELIALIARYHRKGDPDVSELGPLAERGDAERLALLSGIIRVAEQLERSRDGAVRAVRVDRRNGQVRLEAESASDARVALWAASRNAGLLSQATGHEVEIEHS